MNWGLEVVLPLCLFLLAVGLVEHLARRWAMPTVGWFLILGLSYGLARRFGLTWLPLVALLRRPVLELATRHQRKLGRIATTIHPQRYGPDRPEGPRIRELHEKA